MKIKSIENIIKFTDEIVSKRNKQISMVLDEKAKIEKQIDKVKAEKKEAVINGTSDDYNKKDVELSELKEKLGNTISYANQLNGLLLVNDSDLVELPKKIFDELSEKEKSIIKEIEPMLISIKQKCDEFNDECNKGNEAIAYFYKNTRNEELYKKFYRLHENNIESVLYYVGNYLQNIKNVLDDDEENK